LERLHRFATLGLREGWLLGEEALHYVDAPAATLRDVYDRDRDRWEKAQEALSTRRPEWID
jgi:hypothetical protein